MDEKERESLEKRSKIARYDRDSDTVKVIETVEGPIVEGGENVGTANNKFDQTYSRKHILGIWTMLNDGLSKMQKDQREQKVQYDKLNAGLTDTDELIKLKNLIGKLQQFDQLKKIEASLDFLEKNIKRHKEDLEVLRPVVTQMKKD